VDKTKFSDKREWKKFSYGLGAILAVIGTVQLALGNTLYPWFYGAGFLVALLGILFPLAIKPLFIFFSYLGLCIGWFMTKVILCFLFYVVFTPLGILFRLFGNRRLDTKFPGEVESYWIEKNSEQSRIDFERQF